MNSIQLVPASQKNQIKKYFDDYLVELSRFDPTIVFDSSGAPIYRWYDCYWQEAGRYPFAFYVGNRFAGLAMVRNVSPNRYEIAEFYVLPNFRRDNNAIDFADRLVKQFDGEISFSARMENVRAVRFWDKFALQFAIHGASVKNNYKTWFVKTETKNAKRTKTM